jgi:hypothetical protein
LRIASDQAFWFSPEGVSYSCVACGVRPPPAAAVEWVAVGVAVVCVGVGVGVVVVLDGVGFGLWVGVGIFASA